MQKLLGKAMKKENPVLQAQPTQILHFGRNCLILPKSCKNQQFFSQNLLMLANFLKKMCL